MFFILSKVLYIFTQPATWFIIAIAGSYFLRNLKWKRICKISAISIFLFFTNSFIFLSVCRKWEIHGKSVIKVGQYDVGIVLGGMFEYNNDLNMLSIRRGGDRIWQAVNLYKSGKIKKILISGDNGYVGDRGLHEAVQLKEILVKWGIDKEDVLTETKSINTHENALFTKNVLKKYPEIKSKLLITSATHMRRSLACFDKVGLKCDAFTTDHYTSEKQFYYWEQFIIPDFARFQDWGVITKEWVGYIVYDVVGYI